MDLLENPSLVVRALRKIPYIGYLLFRVYDKVLRSLAIRWKQRTFFNHYLSCDSRDMIQNRIMHFGTWEPEISCVFQNLVKPGDIVADVGANVGYFTLLSHSLVGPLGQVVAFEASTPVFLKLCGNVSDNQLANIKLWPVAISSDCGEATIYSAPLSNVGMTTTVAARGFPATEQVRTFTLDCLLSEHERHRLTFIKIDIEGAEIPVLEQLLDSLQVFPALRHVLVEASVQDDPEKWESIFQRFKCAGFQAFGIRNQYDIGWYFRERKNVEPAKLEKLPQLQTDILFSLEKELSFG